MKNKYWIMLLGAIAAWCLVLTIVPASNQEAGMARIKSGDRIITVNLQEAQEFTLESAGGYNTVTVKDGKIAVTGADCPDQYCVQRGFCGGGTPIVCLPHGLVIEFLGDQEIDGLLG